MERRKIEETIEQKIQRKRMNHFINEAPENFNEIQRLRWVEAKMEEVNNQKTWLPNFRTN